MAFSVGTLLRAAQKAATGGLKGAREGRADAVDQAMRMRKLQQENEDRKRQRELDALQQEIMGFNLQRGKSAQAAGAAQAAQEATELAALRGAAPEFANLSREAIEAIKQKRLTTTPKSPAEMPGTAEYLKRVSEEAKARAIGTAAATPPDQKRTEGQRRAAVLYESARGAADVLDRAKPPSAYETGVELLLPKSVENVGLGAEREQVNQAGRQFADAMLKMTSGASSPTKEVESYLSFLLPSFGEEPETTMQKKAARARLLNALKTAAGSGGEVDPDEVVRLLASAAQRSPKAAGSPAPRPAADPRRFLR